jgi:predicted acyl esterase
VERRYNTELVKNVLIPMSDGVTLAADLYRPRTQEPVPTLLSIYPYRKDDSIGPGLEAPLRTMARAGYACLLVDVRGTGNSGGNTTNFVDPRERRDYYEVVEWTAAQPWCDGNVGAWGMSYGSESALLMAAERPPHLRAIAGFHGVEDKWSDLFFVGGRLSVGPFVAAWGPAMAGSNFMPPGYRDPEGRWLSVWREHLEGNVPWLVTAFDLASAGEVSPEPFTKTISQIETPVYLWSGWHDVSTKEMIEAYRCITAPKKLTVGPWMHEFPDEAGTGRLDHLRELRRWFDYWLRGVDTGIMDEPQVWIWVYGADTWAHELDFPSPEVEERHFYLDAENRLSLSAPSGEQSGIDSCVYDATAGAYGDLRSPSGLGVGQAMDQRLDEIKGLVYTSAPLQEGLEICGVPQASIQYAGTTPNPLLVVKLTDVAPSGASTLITSGWLDLERSREYPSSWGEVSQDGCTVRLNLIPTAYQLQAGHRLRVFVSGSDFPRSLPSCGPGDVAVRWGNERPSSVRLPVRLARTEAMELPFLSPEEALATPHLPAPLYRIEHDPAQGTVRVRLGSAQSLGIDGGEGPATATWEYESAVTASQRQPCEPSAHAKGRIVWEGGNERIELETTMAFRPTGLDLCVNITLNGAPYWEKVWTRQWPQREWAV